MAQQLRIGVIGGGGIAGAHVRVYKEMSDVEIVAVSDIVPGKAEEFITRHNLTEAKAFTDHKELLALDIDGVSICTPNAAHYVPVIDALRAGKHVIVEKPLSVTLDEGIDMVRVAEETGKILTVGFQSRYSPMTIAARELIQSGALGSVYYAETGGGRRKGIPGRTFVSKALAGGGVMLDIGCYSIDTTMHLLGNPRPLTVSAVTSAHFGNSPKYSETASTNPYDREKFDVEDFSAAFIRLEGGINFIVRISWAMHMDTLGPSIILGTDGGIKMERGSLKLFHDQSGRSAETNITVPAEDNRNAWRQKVETFVRAIQAGGPAPIPAKEILYGQAILDAIYRSADANKEISVELPDEI